MRGGRGRREEKRLSSGKLVPKNWETKTTVMIILILDLNWRDMPELALLGS